MEEKTKVQAPSPQKALRFNLKIRVYGQASQTTLSHGYCVDDTPSGISHVIGEFVLDLRKVTLSELRLMIQYDKSGHMDRRSLMMQEALFIMNRLPNLYNRPKAEITKYMFGFVRKDRREVRLIHTSREGEYVADLIGATDLFGHDLILVPLTQISPALEMSLEPKKFEVKYDASDGVVNFGKEKVKKKGRGKSRSRSPGKGNDLVSSPST